MLRNTKKALSRLIVLRVVKYLPSLDQCCPQNISCKPLPYKCCSRLVLCLQPNRNLKLHHRRFFTQSFCLSLFCPCQHKATPQVFLV